MFVALLTIALKTLAYVLTHSVGLLSDALESVINLVGALMALWMLIVAARPPDADHAYGHTKAEYFSSILEGTLILAAAAGIIIAATQRLLHPRALEQIGLGLGVSIGATLLNLTAAIVILRAGTRYHSITLEANAHHLLTDVWTTAGVLSGVGAVAVTGWTPLDPIVALLVAANIVRTGVKIVGRSVSGLMDTALPPDEQQLLREALAGYATAGVQFHALRTRQAGPRRFVSVHILVPGDWTVRRGHELLEQIESQIRDLLPNVTVLTHLEALDDPSSWDDIALDRGQSSPPHPGAAGRR